MRPHRRFNTQGQSDVSRGDLLQQKLLRDATPSFHCWHVAEPKLIFADGHRCEDPKTGLTLYGPAGLGKGARSSIRLGIIGTGETVQMVRNWLKLAEHRITAGRDKKGRAYDPLLSPDFPGFGAYPPFHCEVELADQHCVTVPGREFERVAEPEELGARISRAIEVVAARLESLATIEHSPDVVLCAMPNVVDLACGPQRVRAPRPVAITPFQKAVRKLRRKAAKLGQLAMDLRLPETGDEDMEHWDFHNALKVRAMRFRLPTQLVWESTLTGAKSTQDPATIAWNLLVALYYKAGNLPWQLDFGASGTCFVGVTFYREGPDPQAPTRISLAQVYSEAGDGLVLKGEPVLWDQKRDRRPHLTRDTAETLLTRAIRLYEQHYDRAPTRVVVHKTSRYWPEELDGFRGALDAIRSYDLLTLEQRGIRFLRLGTEPPLRGTVVQLANRDYLVYTHGYVPFLKCYPGMRIPNPIEVVEHHGDSDAERVCSEILALTKLNWNNCSYGSADPVTIAFSQQVGRILTELPGGVTPATNYRFYM